MDDDFPVFTPIGIGPQVTWSKSRHPDDCIAEAEERCAAGDESVLQVFDHIVQNGTDARDLGYCLKEAVSSGNEAIVRKLLSLGVPFLNDDIKIAVSQNATNLLALFLQNGWDINTPLACNLPPLLAYAVGPEQDIDERTVSWFITNGAKGDAGCGMDVTPLSFAVQHAPLRVINMLLDPLGSVRNGQLLHHAAMRNLNDSGEICRYVLQRCDDSFGVNDIMYRHHAMSYESLKVIGLGTPLHEAARKGRPETALVLLEHGVDPLIRDSNGRTALEVAILHGNEAVAQCLKNRAARL